MSSDPCYSGLEPTVRVGNRECRWPGLWSVRPVLAAAHLLERWLPGARVAVAAGTAPARSRVSWQPTADEVAAYGGYPAVFADAGAAGLRYPVGVEVLAGPADRESGVDEPAAAELVADLVASVLPDGPQRDRVLVRTLATGFVRYACEVLRVRVAAEPGGAPLGEVHLLARETRGDTVRLAVSADGPAAVGAGADPLCLAAGHDDPLPDAGPDARFGARVAAIIALLNKHLMATQNDPVGYYVALQRHGLTPDDAAFRAWWDDQGATACRPAAWSHDDEPYFEGPLIPAELPSVVADFARGSTEYALYWDWVDTHDGEPPVIEDDPAVRDAHPVSWLCRDLVDQLIRRVSPLLAYRLTWCALSTEETEGWEPRGHLVLVGATEVAVLSQEFVC